MFLSALRKPVDAYTPWLAGSYRIFRDLASWRFSRKTSYGFLLAGNRRMANGDCEAGEVRTFLRYCETCDEVFDIGANVGFYSCLAASRGKHVVAFEPAPRNLKFLCRNLWSNGFSDVEVFPVGLGKKPGLMPIYGSGTMASFVPGWAQAPTDKLNLVPVTTLDLITAGRLLGKKIFIKLDVEGFELGVLEGAVDTLNRNPKPVWLVEVLLRHSAIPGGLSHHFREVFELFWKYGYKCRLPDSTDTEVTPETIARWLNAPLTAPEAGNFMFFAE